MDVRTWPARDRYDRHVRRAKVRAGGEASRQRLGFTVEEALRLASLPGENEGRFYYFRFLRITGLPAGGDRRIWLEKFQGALSEEAEQAIHGADPRAASAGAVFFRGEQEALQVLLEQVLARRPVTEWFWPMVIGEGDATLGSAAPDAELIPAIVERLRARPASWVAVAAAVFVRPEFDVIGTLRAVPERLAAAWIAEMVAAAEAAGPAAARFCRQAAPAVREAARFFGARSPRTAWLATLAILYDSPSDLIAGTAVRRALRALEQLAAEAGEIESARPALTYRELPPALMSSEPPAPSAGPAAGRAVLPTIGRKTEAPAQRDTEASKSFEIVEGGVLAGSGDAANERQYPAGLEIAGAHIPAIQPVAPPPGRDVPLSRTAPDSAPPSESWSSASTAFSASPGSSAELASSSRYFYAGQETVAAGLFFLLNALRWLGIEQALEEGLARADPHFLPRLLRCLARHAGIGSDDPVAVWLDTLLETEADAGLACGSACWPGNLRPSRDAAPPDYLLRVWCLAARRWCWRMAQITLAESVARFGVFSVNRTDLDVSLPIEEIDTRIRRAGLDLDPGWLPWFGWVVRFHYLFRGEFHG